MSFVNVWMFCFWSKREDKYLSLSAQTSEDMRTNVAANKHILVIKQSFISIIIKNANFITFTDKFDTLTKDMGQTSTKPIDHQQLKLLQQQYESMSKGKLLPGEPIHMKLISIFQKNQYSNHLNNQYKKLDRYQLIKQYNEQSLKRDRFIYDFRKSNFPFFVQVVYYVIQEQQCRCINEARMTIYTQHVQTRLINFKKKSQEYNKYGQLELFNSFSLDEGVYVLISALHAYELLYQQFNINYPNPFTIGINSKAQIKAWIHQNWALNQENHRKLNENLVIQELINIVEERMQGNFTQLLNTKVNYMNFSFRTIQEILSKYTINFQRGKQTLEYRINNRTVFKDRSKTFSDKFSIGRYRENQPVRLTNDRGLITFSNEKYRVQQTKKVHNSLNSTAVRNNSVTPRIIVQSPKKKINFTYHQSPSSIKQRVSSPYKQPYPYNTKQKTSTPVNMLNCPYIAEVHSIPQFDYSHKNNTIHSKTNFHRNGSMTPQTTRQYYNANYQSVIDQRLYSQKGTSTNVEFQRREPSININIKRQNTIYTRNLHYNFHNSQPQLQKQNVNPPIVKTASFDMKNIQQPNKNIQQFNKQTPQEKKVTLNEITQQFKNLLKSQHRIQDKQQQYYIDEGQFEKMISQQYSNIQLKDEEQEIDKGINENTETFPFINSFEQIMEQDEDVSYSHDDIKLH